MIYVRGNNIESALTSSDVSITGLSSSNFVQIEDTGRTYDINVNNVNYVYISTRGQDKTVNINNAQAIAMGGGFKSQDNIGSPVILYCQSPTGTIPNSVKFYTAIRSSDVPNAPIYLALTNNDLNSYPSTLKSVGGSRSLSSNSSNIKIGNKCTFIGEDFFNFYEYNDRHKVVIDSVIFSCEEADEKEKKYSYVGSQCFPYVKNYTAKGYTFVCPMDDGRNTGGRAIKNINIIGNGNTVVDLFGCNSFNLPMAYSGDTPSSDDDKPEYFGKVTIGSGVTAVSIYGGATDYILGEDVNEISFRTQSSTESVRNLICYAKTPPTVYTYNGSWRVTRCVYARKTIKVPAESLQLYIDAGWGSSFNEYSSYSGRVVTYHPTIETI